MKKPTIFLVMALVAIVQAGHCQTDKHTRYREQLWFGYFNQTRLTKRVGFWADIHYRQTGHFIDRPFQFLVRPALTYYITDELRVNIGYVYASHFPAAGFQTTRPEHRTWQQISLTQKHAGFTMRQWLRFEQRFNRKIINDELADGYNFNYRLRYSLAFSIPLKGKEIVPGTPFISVIDEIFVNFGDRIIYNTFDQNRFFSGLGYQFTSQLSVQLGYMNVYQQEASGYNYISSNTIRLYFLQSLDLRKREPKS